MPYPKLAEGNRVFDAVFDAETNFADWNELQDQLKTVLGPRVISIPSLPGYGNVDAIGGTATNWIHYRQIADTGAHPPYSIGGTDPSFWEAVGGTHGSILLIPLPALYAGERITTARCVTAGDVDAADDYKGLVGIYYRDVDASPTTLQSVADITTDPFTTGGTGTWELSAATAINHTIVSGREYLLMVRAAADATSRTCRYLGAYMTVQFGN